MSERPQQNFSNHRRFFPLYHFFAFPVIAMYAGYATWQLIQTPSLPALGLAVYAWAILAGLLAARLMALRVQDRVIRLEETIRMQRVLGADMHGEISKLRPRHMVALRFAPDDELPELVRRTLAGELSTTKSIKQAIRVWRPDWLRA